jgi:hypothetical protein
MSRLALWPPAKEVGHVWEAFSRDKLGNPGVDRLDYLSFTVCTGPTEHACSVSEGALADLVLVDGNPIDNIKLIEDPGRNFLVIMKDGTMYKDHLSSDKQR